MKLLNLKLLLNIVAHDHESQTRDPLVTAFSIFGRKYELLVEHFALYLTIRPSTWLASRLFLITLSQGIELAQRLNGLRWGKRGFECEDHWTKYFLICSEMPFKLRKEFISELALEGYSMIDLIWRGRWLILIMKGEVLESVREWTIQRLIILSCISRFDMLV